MSWTMSASLENDWKMPPLGSSTPHRSCRFSIFPLTLMNYAASWGRQMSKEAADLIMQLFSARCSCGLAELAQDILVLAAEKSNGTIPIPLSSTGDNPFAWCPTEINSAVQTLCQYTTSSISTRSGKEPFSETLGSCQSVEAVLS